MKCIGHKPSALHSDATMAAIRELETIRDHVNLYHGGQILYAATSTRFLSAWYPTRDPFADAVARAETPRSLGFTLLPDLPVNGGDGWWVKIYRAWPRTMPDVLTAWITRRRKLATALQQRFARAAAAAPTDVVL